MINIVITWDGPDEEGEAHAIDDWIRDGEFDAEINIRLDDE